MKVALYKDIDWAIRQKAPAPCKHVLLILANRTNKNHQCFPSLTSIAADTGMDRRTVMRSLNILEGLTLLKRQKRGINSTLYTISVGAERPYSTKNKKPEKVGAERPQDQGPTAPRGTPPLEAERPGGRGTPPLSVGAHRPTEPPIEPSFNPQKKGIRPRTRAPDTIPITDAMRKWATENGVKVKLETETEIMLDHHRGKGNLQADWIATWRTWMRNSLKFERHFGNNGNGNGNGLFPEKPTEAEIQAEMENYRKMGVVR